MKRGKKILVAMSGGVDSSVAACLLKEQGYHVTGVFMRSGVRPDALVAPPSRRCGPVAPPSRRCRHGRDARATGAAGCHLGDESVAPPEPANPTPASEGRRQACCSAAAATDARRVADELGIPFYVLDFARDFSRLIDHFADEYAAARTPNPCVLCNQWIKFGGLVAYADTAGANLIATGHYARIETGGKRSRLLRARCLAKDQSYALFSVDPSVLRRTLFPLGEMTKEEVRAHARRFGLPQHAKPESQDICFVPNGDYTSVVRSRRPDTFRRGPIRHVDGRVLGEHDGLPHFTIGQRRGLGVAVGSPVYVVSLDPATDTVTVGPRDALLSPTATASGVRWLCEVPTEPIRADVQIRYQHKAAPADVLPLPGSRMCVRFDEPQLAVTPGQAIVCYRGDEVLGGGWIEGP
ncbi:MAG: tRNA 2-thiouridine(34) synthase MnmA [Phycisphaerae bacterium]|nr:tRNA 2-thiouridine(34) synthase MnmA [Phycisphaerae bacterium]